MTRLQSVEFSELAGFGTFEIDAFGSVTSLTGPNGAGKTTILLALRYVFDVLAQRSVSDVLPEGDPWYRPAGVMLVFDVADHPAPDFFNGEFSPKGNTLRLSIAFSEDRFLIRSVEWGLASLSIRAAPVAADIKRLRAELDGQVKEVENIKKRKADFVRVNQANNKVHNQEYVQAIRDFAATIASTEADIERRTQELDGKGLVGVSFAGLDDQLISLQEFDEFLKSLPLPGVHFIRPDEFFETSLPGIIDSLMALKKGKRKLSDAFREAEEQLTRFLQAPVDIWEDDDGKRGMNVGGVPYQRASAGTRISITFFGVMRKARADDVIIWDEPENGLHPTRRAMVLQLMIKDKRQFVLATHASEFVPFLEKGGLAYRCLGETTDETEGPRLSVEPVRDRRHIFEVLDALGVHPARTLFTANVVIWVEGPTELMFYRHWLTLRLKDKGFHEGFHYSFAQYGGALINYLEVAEDAVVKLMFDMLSMCRHPVVLVDSDFKSADEALHPSTHLKAGAAKLKKQIEGMGTAGRFQLTAGREVENYLSDEAILHAARTVWVEHAPYKDALIDPDFSVDRYESFADALAAHLKAAGAVEENDSEKVKGRTRWGAANKVEMMLAALNCPGLVESDLKWECSRQLNEIEAFIVEVARAGD